MDNSSRFLKVGWCSSPPPRDLECVSHLNNSFMLLLLPCTQAMSDFNLALDLGFLTRNRKYTFFKPKFIL